MSRAFLDELAWRDLIFQESDREGLGAFLEEGPQSLYAGFDPTADSLHVGNLIPLLTLRRFQLAGHIPIALVGGATGLIGDPSGKSAERNLSDRDVVAAWCERFQTQIAHFLDFSPGPFRATLVDNYSWISSLSALDFLRDVGKHFSVNAMMAKESVSSRLDREHGGISYTEFSYMILQAYDFYHLAKTYGCRFQVGGSDQWGNMVAGIDLIRRKLGLPAYVFTVPLVTTADGKKFGKSEGNAVWIDPEKTSPYAFYQYWINTHDDDVGRFLRLFTFLRREEIEELEERTKAHPERREGQRRLAEEMTRLVHGESELDQVVRASRALFGKGALDEVEPRILKAAVSSAPTLHYGSLEAVPEVPIVLADLGLARSRSDARRLISGGGLYINNRRFERGTTRLTGDDFIRGELCVIRRGNKTYGIVHIGESIDANASERNGDSSDTVEVRGEGK